MKLFESKRKRFSLLVGFLVGLSLMAAACGPAETEMASTEMKSPLATPDSGGAADVTIPDEAEEIADLVQQDLAERLSVDRGQIEVFVFEKVEWPDSSLGCPKPGTGYLDVETPGFRAVLEADGQKYEYHTSLSNFVLCQDGKAEEPVTDKPDQKNLDSAEAALVEQAMADLGARLQSSAPVIELVSVEAVEWPDSSMGCPQPGMNYLMVVTPGYLVKLRADGAIYQYHGNAQAVAYCENPQPPLDSETPDDVQAKLVQAAKDDLAQRLSIKGDSIEVIKAESVQWPDASLGCPKPGMMYAQMVTPGYQIILSVGGEEYDYHGSALEVFLCEE